MSKAYKYEIVSKTADVFFWHPDGRILPVTITGCDFDKRVTFTCKEELEFDEYKWGYFYNTYEDVAQAITHELTYIDWEVSGSAPDCINPWKLLLNREDYHNYTKHKRKEDAKDTLWCVHLGATYEDEYNWQYFEFKTLKKALTFFGKVDQHKVKLAYLSGDKCGELLELEDKQLWDTSDKRFNKHFRQVKASHVGRVKGWKDLRKQGNKF
jgi:hypothetical protein